MPLEKKAAKIKSYELLSELLSYNYTDGHS